ncbi:MAG TPA: carboxypeptidase-like regulatory domain-containing protein, partial [Patescibacteria group bacterium]|nr:carboxypeptidase-like regulatory domain-containing protein [Patescibacteria group bacterium]
MLSKRVVVAVLSLICILALSAAPMFAQATNTGTIVGQVTDPSGAAVAGATVTLTDTATNIARSTATNNDGRYTFVNVPPATYSVTITAKGFRAAKLSDQKVQVGLQLTLNVALQVGATTEVVEVTATNTELQTLNATVGNTVSGVAVDSLPSIARDVSTFVVLQPGVSPEGYTAGAVYDQNSFSLDGGQNTNDMDGSMNIYTPSYAGDPSGVVGGGPTGVMPTPIDSIEEFKANTTGQTADFNSSAG